MAAILRGLGTVPEVREELMMSVMSGAREVEQVLTRTEGRGSRGEVDGFMEEIVLERSAVVMGERKESRWLGGGGRAGSRSGVVAEEEAS